MIPSFLNHHINLVCLATLGSRSSSLQTRNELTAPLVTHHLQLTVTSFQKQFRHVELIDIGTINSKGISFDALNLET